jgi:polyhydroxybutyrate depolymerase
VVILLLATACSRGASADGVVIPGPTPPPVARAAEQADGLTLVEVGPDGFGEVRSYWVHLPRHPVPGVPPPVILAFHGGKGSNGRTGMAKHWTSRFDEPWILVFPNGQLRDPDVGGWDDLLEPLTNGEGFQVAVVRTIVADVLARFGGDPRHVYAVGFSSGGHVVNQLACSTRDLFAGLGRTGRTLLASTRDRCRQPTDAPQIMILGTDDRSAPLEGKPDPRSGQVHELSARAAWSFWLDAAGCVGRPVTVERLSDRGDRCTVEVKTHAGCRDTVAMRYVHVENGTHAWFDTTDPRSACRDLDTTDTFVQFFETYAGLVGR